ncbi:MAG TPA: polyprenyl synthetase family protein [Candidatus Binatia bacterium]|nr:polyprenyl synthetase family protein [Candidatus Binatia bacterium]
MSDELKQMMDEMLPQVEQEMKTVLCAHQPGSTDLFYQMLHYHMGWLDEALHPTESNGGKRIRPVLTLLSASATGADWRRAIPVAAAIELLHNFTLIHDDIQDASPTRRGRPTIWKIWGIPQAINSGDCLFALSHAALYRLRERGIHPQIVVRAAGRFDDTCLALTLGQHHDMNFESQMAVSVDDYLSMIGGKTAALLALCGELGSLVAGADEGTVANFAAFARNLGLAFQIKDDILGIWGDEAAIGKSAATDIATRKKTLPVLFGLAQSKELKRLYAMPDNHETFVSDVVQLLDACGALEFAQAQAKIYSQAALKHLDAGAPQGEAAEALHQLAARLLYREQ